MNGLCVLRTMSGVEVLMEAITAPGSTTNLGKCVCSIYAMRTVEACLVGFAYSAPFLEGARGK